MSSNTHRIHHIVATVGENPLPMMAALLAHNPRQVTLLHTEETSVNATAISLRYRATHSEAEVRLVGLASPNDARRIREALGSIEGTGAGWTLDYTGGTKVMAAHARLALERAGGEDRDAYYVDDRVQSAVFDDGTKTNLNSVDMTVDDIAALHGIRLIQTETRRPEVLSTSQKGFIPSGLIREDAQHIRKRLVVQKTRVKHVGGGRLSSGHRFERVIAWAVTSWLQRDHPDDSWEVLHGLQHYIGETDQGAEVDVVIRLGYRLGVITCHLRSSPGWVPVVKQKLHEASIRGHQLGGGRVRVAAATNIPEESENLGRLHDEANALGIIPRAAIFDAGHIAGWLGAIENDEQPDTTMIADWFDARRGA